MTNIKLSIIIPYYKTYKETIKLLDILGKQLTDEVEVIVIEDGKDDQVLDFKNCILLRNEENHGLSYARNEGIKAARGNYIVFVDSDDYVAEDYIETIINKINTSNFDYCYFSWKFVNKGDTIIIKDTPPIWNLAVWNAVYKKEYVELFDEEIRIYEDIPWQKKMRAKNGKKEIINKVLYFYNDSRPGSLTDIGSKQRSEQNAV